MYAILFGRFKIPLILKGFFFCLSASLAPGFLGVFPITASHHAVGFPSCTAGLQNYRRVNLDV